VLGHEAVAVEMADEGAHARVVHRVAEVTHENDILFLVEHLAQGERSPEHTHIHVYAHDDDVLDAALLHQVKRFRTIGDGITFLDVDGRDLAFPGAEWLAPGLTVATAVRVIDWKGGLILGVDVAPALERNSRLHFGRLLGEFPHW